MAITISKVKLLDGYPQSVGAKTEAVGFVVLSGTYVAGGFQIDPVQFGLKDLHHVEHGSGGYEILNYNHFAVFDLGPVGVYFILHVRTTGAEVAAGVDLTGETYLLYLRGF
jgi:hypothetical protein